MQSLTVVRQVVHKILLSSALHSYCVSQSGYRTTLYRCNKLMSTLRHPRVDTRTLELNSSAHELEEWCLECGCIHTGEVLRDNEKDPPRKCNSE